MDEILVYVLPVLLGDGIRFSIPGSREDRPRTARQHAVGSRHHPPVPRPQAVIGVVLDRVMPHPATSPGRLRGARTGAAQPPRLPEPLVVTRRVPVSGAIMAGGQKIQAGIKPPGLPAGLPCSGQGSPGINRIACAGDHLDQRRVRGGQDGARGGTAPAAPGTRSSITRRTSVSCSGSRCGPTAISSTCPAGGNWPGPGSPRGRHDRRGRDGRCRCPPAGRDAHAALGQAHPGGTGRRGTGEACGRFTETANGCGRQDRWTRWPASPVRPRPGTPSTRPGVTAASRQSPSPATFSRPRCRLA